MTGADSDEYTCSVVRFRRTVVAFFALGLGLAGCATAETLEGVVLERAEFDMGCDELQIVEIGPNTYGVRGCGQQTSYVIMSTGGSSNSCRPGQFKSYVEQQCTAVMNSDSKPDSETSQAPPAE